MLWVPVEVLHCSTSTPFVNQSDLSRALPKPSMPAIYWGKKTIRQRLLQAMHRREIFAGYTYRGMDASLERRTQQQFLLMAMRQRDAQTAGKSSR